MTLLQSSMQHQGVQNEGVEGWAVYPPWQSFPEEAREDLVLLTYTCEGAVPMREGRLQVPDRVGPGGGL